MEIPYVRASTPVEQELVIIWSEVLDLDPDQVGVLDEFLDLGGDSLLAGQVVSRVLKAFQVEVPLRTLYEAPTISAIASAVVQTTSCPCSLAIFWVITTAISATVAGSRRALSGNSI